jgi:hypothetical protein
MEEVNLVLNLEEGREWRKVGKLKVTGSALSRSSRGAALGRERSTLEGKFGVNSR